MGISRSKEWKWPVESANGPPYPQAQAILDRARAGEIAIGQRSNGAEARTLLMLAAVYHFLDEVDFLLQAGEDLHATQRHDGLTPLYCAAITNTSPIVRRLVLAGADPNAAALRGMNVLMWALKHPNIDMVQCLIAAGGDIVTASVDTPLDA